MSFTRCNHQCVQVFVFTSHALITIILTISRHQKFLVATPDDSLPQSANAVHCAKDSYAQYEKLILHLGKKIVT